jgi:hypothetical protein
MKKWSLVALLAGFGATSLAHGGDLPCIAPQMMREDQGLGAYQDVPAAGGTFSVLVLTPSAQQCGLGVREASDFVALQNQGERVTYAVSPNTGAARTAMLVGSSGATFTTNFEVRQAAATQPTTPPAADGPSNDATVLGAQRTCSNVAMTIVKSGATLKPNTWVLSPSRQYKLIYQPDGKLALYRASGELVWNNGKPSTGGLLKMQTDGNLVSYDGANRPIWASNTANKPGSVLAIQNDGNVVVYKADSCTPYWAIR